MENKGNGGNKNEIDFKGMIVVHVDLYYLDESTGNLVEHGNPSNHIQAMDLEGLSRYKGIYNARNKQLLTNAGARKEFGEMYLDLSFLKRFSIPDILIDWGKQLTEKEVAEYNMASIIYKHGYYYVDQALSDRLNGQLPTVKYDDLDYIVNIEKRELMQVHHPDQKFIFPDYALTDPAIVYYDSDRKTPINDSQEISPYPKGVMEVHFPPLSTFDIVGYAKMNNIPPTALVCNNPLKPDPAIIISKELPITIVSMTNQKATHENSKKQQKKGRNKGLGK